MEQEYSLPSQVYGPEHSETSLHIKGKGFYYRPTQADVDRKRAGVRGIGANEDGCYVYVEFGGEDKEGRTIDHECIPGCDSSSYCIRQCDFDSASDLHFEMPKIDMSRANDCSNQSDGIGTWNMRFSINEGLSWASPYGTDGDDDSLPRDYTVYSTPSVSYMTPRSGPLSGGTNVTIFGSFFDTNFIGTRGEDGEIFDNNTCILNNTGAFMVCRLIKGKPSDALDKILQLDGKEDSKSIWCQSGPSRSQYYRRTRMLC